MVLYEFSLPGTPTLVAGDGVSASPFDNRRILVPGRVLDLIERDRRGLDLRPRSPTMPPVTMTIRGW